MNEERVRECTQIAHGFDSTYNGVSGRIIAAISERLKP